MSELPAGRELDALVAEKVMGWYRKSGRREWIAPGAATGWLVNDVDDHDDLRGYLGVWSPSTDIAAAWEIANIRQVLAPGEYSSHGHHPTLWHAYCGAPDGYGDDIWEDAYGETAPLAICRAALKAIGAR